MGGAINHRSDRTVIRNNILKDPSAGDRDDSDSRQTRLTYDAFGRQLTRTLPESQQ